ncbi:GntR family transcriptional regulator [Ammoniphilus sp. 3BR4]|uniref:GntR family transcriptional regulator n=1 Tax=Ammoniphilus sp. 3BR4 TaxID=3158265 RepID=UPI0034657A07
MSFSKIEKVQSLKETAYEKIKNAIINHSILPGDPLFERYLSDSLGISRTPVREAIHQLEMEGWVYSVPRKGTFVCPISLQDVEEVLQLRKAIETLVVELLIPVISNEQIEKLERIHGLQSSRRLDNQEFISIDKDFHLSLAELSNNRRVVMLIQTLSDQMRWFGIRAVTIPGRTEQTLQEHLAILEGLKNRDFEQAKKAVLLHIEHTKEAVVSSLKDGTGGE